MPLQRLCRNVRFTEAEIKELKYAALLHDFGKVGVREPVLVKEKKLFAGRLENIQYRILLAREKLRTSSLSRHPDVDALFCVMSAKLLDQSTRGKPVGW